MTAKKHIKVIVGGMIFLVLGLVFLVFGLCLKKNNQQFFETARESKAVISEIETYRDSDGDKRHRTYVTYEIDGVLYENISYGYYVSGMYEGEVVSIWYDPDDPSSIKSKEGSNIGNILTIGIGGLFAIIGGCMVVFHLLSGLRGKGIKQKGVRLQLPITQIGVNTQITVNGFPAYYIICEGRNPFTGQTIQYKSKNVYRDLFLEMQEGDIVDIYVDERKPKKYFVDIDSCMRVNHLM